MVVNIILRNPPCFFCNDNMNPNNEARIYLTLKFIAEHAQEHCTKYPIITFDQSIWWKAFNLFQTEPAGGPITNVIVRLGAFYTQMSLLVSIVHLML